MPRSHLTPLRQVKRRLRHNWHALTGHPLAPEKWVFVLGCYNSGTTLLTRILDSHPELTALPREGVELTDRLPRPEQFGWPRMWDQCRSSVEVSMSQMAALRAARIKRQWSHFVDAASILVEKSPANILRLHFLHTFFQPAYFIYIVRNGYAVAEGIRRKADPGAWGNRQYQQYPIEMCARQWVATDQIIEEAMEQPHYKILPIRYENLTQDPSAVLPTVSEFLDINDFAGDLADQSFEVHRQSAPISNMNASSFGRLSEDEVAAIHAVAKKTLAKYDYLTGEESSL